MSTVALIQYLIGPVEKVLSRNHMLMRKAVGFLIVLWGLSQFFNTAFPALDSAARESLRAVETAAVVSQLELRERM